MSVPDGERGESMCGEKGGGGEKKRWIGWGRKREEREAEDVKARGRLVFESGSSGRTTQVQSPECAPPRPNGPVRAEPRGGKRGRGGSVREGCSGRCLATAEARRAGVDEGEDA